MVVRWIIASHPARIARTTAARTSASLTGSRTRPATTSGVPSQARVVMCGHGERAMTAASVLARAGRDDIAVLRGSPDDWANTHQTRLESGV